jgi:hypothetical protein
LGIWLASLQLPVRVAFPSPRSNWAIPDINKEAVALTQEFNMDKVFETARMYSKSFPEIELGKIFGITSFELG